MKKSKRSLAKGATCAKGVKKATPKGSGKREYKPLQAFWMPALEGTEKSICLTHKVEDYELVTYYLYTNEDSEITLESVQDLANELGQALHLIPIKPEAVLGALSGEQGNCFAERVDVIFLDDSIALPMTRHGADFLVKVGDPTDWSKLDDNQLAQEAATLFALYVAKVEGLQLRDVLQIAKESAVAGALAPAMAAMMAGGPAPDQQGWLQHPPSDEPFTAAVKVQKVPGDNNADLLIFDEERTFAYALSKASRPMDHLRLANEMGATNVAYYDAEVRNGTVLINFRLFGLNW